MRLALLAAAFLFSSAALAQAGAPNLAFGESGVVRLAPSSPGGAQAVAPLADGGVLVGGTDGDAVVYRLDAAGALDASFGAGGVARSAFGQPSTVTALAVRSDGRIVATVQTTGDDGVDGGALVGFTADGVPDTAFGSEGRVQGEIGWLDLGLDATGRLLALGTDTSGGPTEGRPTIGRFDAAGAPDPTYGVGGLARPDLGAASVTSFDVYPDGRAALAGFSSDAAPLALDGLVIRLTSAGEIDPEFSRVDLDLDGAIDVFLGVDVDSDGRVVAVGYSNDLASGTSEGIVLRVRSDGVPDGSFGTGGLAVLASGQPLDQIAAVIFQPDGKILAAGIAGTSTSAHAFAARLRLDGSPDPEFGVGGVALVEPPSGDSEGAAAITLLSDGDVVIAGGRLLPEGGSDRTVVACLLNDIVVADQEPPEGRPMALTHAGANPSRDGRVTLALGAAAPVRLVVYDVRGRAVAVLHDGTLGAGAHVWPLGAGVPGVYLVRATSGGRVQTVPVTVVR